MAAVLPAAATNWAGSTGQTGCGKFNMQDDSTFTYYRDSLTTNVYNAVGHAINNAIAPTDVSVAAESGSHTIYIDVAYMDDDYTGTYCGYTWQMSGSLVGYTTCESLSGSGCNHFHILSDSDYLNNYQTQTYRRSHACHELGHSLGLKHPSGTGGCIESSSSTTYSSHDEGHINANY